MINQIYEKKIKKIDKIIHFFEKNIWILDFHQIQFISGSDKKSGGYFCGFFFGLFSKFNALEKV